jgi:hypothetical protein
MHGCLDRLLILIPGPLLMQEDRFSSSTIRLRLPPTPCHVPNTHVHPIYVLKHLIYTPFFLFYCSVGSKPMKLEMCYIAMPKLWKYLVLISTQFSDPLPILIIFQMSGPKPPPPCVHPLQHHPSMWRIWRSPCPHHLLARAYI